MVSYVANLPPDMRKLVLDELTLPERRGVEKTLKERVTNRRKRAEETERQRQRLSRVAEDAKEQERRKRSELLRALQECRATGGDVGRLAAASRYTQTELASLLSKDERQTVRKYRKEELSSLSVRRRLNCTLAELNRWTASGRLPFFRQRLFYGLPKKTLGRTWLPGDVERAVNQVSSWRRQDDARKTYRRRGLRAAEQSQ
ncbi:MAG: hypothetical protein ACRETT_04565 [Steroidobacteraceae bacterium]